MADTGNSNLEEEQSKMHQLCLRNDWLSQRPNLKLDKGRDSKASILGSALTIIGIIFVMIYALDKILMFDSYDGSLWSTYHL